MPEKVDVVIIGAGSAGLAALREVRKRTVARHASGRRRSVPGHAGIRRDIVAPSKMRRCAATLAALLSLSVAASASDRSATDPIAGWERDLDQLVATIEQKHKQPFHRIDKPTFDGLVADARATLRATSHDFERAVLLVKVAAAIGDGHTNVRPWERFHVLPVRWAWMEGELRVTGAPPGRREWLGGKVRRIGNASAAEARKRVEVLIAAGESPTFVQNWSQYLLRMPEVLAALGIADDTGPVRIELEDDAGRRHTVVLDPLTAKQNERLAVERPYAVAPLASSRPGRDFWYARVPETGLVYLHFAGYPPREQFISAAKSLVAELEAPGTTALLVDLRDNGGGDFKAGRRFIEFIRPAIDKRALRVYVAIGRQTYSAGMTNATDFKAAFRAPYVGEVSGARPVGYQENFPFTLAHSGLPGSVAKEHFRFQAEDTAGLIPDHPVAWTWTDYAAGRDAVLERVLTLEAAWR